MLSGETATVVLGLVAAATWGSGDFAGGMLVRRAPVLGVALVSQLVGTAIALILALVRGETMPLPADLPWSVLAGASGGVGIVALYRGLAIGRMGVVAPVTGVLAATIPVGFGIIVEGLPSVLVEIGIGLAIVAVVLVSRVDDGRAGPSGMGLALVAGVAIGGFGVAVSQISNGHAFGPLTMIRATEALLIVAIAILGRQAWRVQPRLLPAMAGVGVLDMAGNAGFILSVQAGSLAVGAMLSSLYPVITVVLAAVVLRERITRDHAVGIVLAAAAITCIAVGSS
jgi:drug/metabolite transporter (DMT)-like permease